MATSTHDGPGTRTVIRRRRRHRPVGYPGDLEHELTLVDGRHVHVRPLRPADLDELRRAITSADPETIHARFLGGAPPLTDDALRRLVELDYDRRMAVAAFTPEGRGVGIARYEGTPGRASAEVAVVVDPHWRHQGVATDLVRTLGIAAVQRGITTFTATTLATNADVRSIVEAMGLRYTERREGEVVEEVIDLDSVRDPDT